MTNLIISIVQYNIAWEDKQANFKKIEKLIRQDKSTDLFVLPEMFSTGFSMNTLSMAEETGGPTVKWMQKIAKEKEAAVCGSIMIKEKGSCFNRLVFVHPEGNIEKYDKRHLFTMGNEQKYYSPGNERLLINYKGFRILPLICYDLRFPVWSRSRNDFDLMIYVANWPAPRRKAWKVLLRARAIENQAYLVAANRTGTDSNRLRYSGDSFAIDAKGKIIQKLNQNQEGILTEKISLESLQKFRRKFPALNDADQFKME